MSRINMNDHLDDMMERIMNEDITAKELELETSRAKSLCKIAEVKLKKEKNIIEAVKLASSGKLTKNIQRQLLGDEVKRINE